MAPLETAILVSRWLVVVLFVAVGIAASIELPAFRQAIVASLKGCLTGSAIVGFAFSVLGQLAVLASDGRSAGGTPIDVLTSMVVGILFVSAVALTVSLLPVLATMVVAYPLARKVWTRDPSIDRLPFVVLAILAAVIGVGVLHGMALSMRVDAGGATLVGLVCLPVYVIPAALWLHSAWRPSADVPSILERPGIGRVVTDLR
jgi:hypothetical protein